MVDVQWAFISIATASLAHFFLRVVLGRNLGAEGLGLYTLAITIYLFGMQFAAFGIGSALTKYVAEFLEDQDTIRKYVSSGMISSIITGVLMGVSLFLVAPFIAISIFHTPELEGMIQLTAICYPFIAIQKAVLGVLNGFRRMHLFALLSIIQNIAVVGASIVLVLLFGMGVMGGVIGLVLATIIVSALCPFLIKDSIKFDEAMWNVPALRATTIFGFYVVLGNAIGFLNTQVDSVFIGFYMSPEQVGIYAIAALLAQTLTLIPSAVQRVTAPTTAALYGKGDIIAIRRLFYTTLKRCFLITSVIALGIAFTGPYIIQALFADQYSSSYFPLLILLIGYTIGASFGAVGATLSSIGKVRLPFRISAVSGVLNIALDVFLIPLFGINGAAVATAVTLITNCGISLRVIRKYIG